MTRFSFNQAGINRKVSSGIEAVNLTSDKDWNAGMGQPTVKPHEVARRIARIEVSFIN
jgi:hypothetical protein